MLNIYPNPANYQLSLKLENNKIKSIQIYNLNGQLIIQQDGDHKYVDVSVLPSGNYFLKAIDSKDQAYSQNFTKQ